MKVLVVDDNLSNRKLLRTTLEAEGVTIVEASDGIGALERLASEKFDAVVSDILMPRMDGYRLFREIRRDPRLRHLPVIACTSTYLSSDDEKLAIKSGADRYLSKPALTEVLLRLLNELTGPDATRPLPPLLNDSLAMDEYNAVLVSKLEEKRAELTERNAALSSANDELAESRARFEGIIASAMDAIITSNEQDGIVLFNAAAETMFGASAASVLGQPIANLLGLGDPAVIGESMVFGAIDRRIGVFKALSGRRANGAEFPVEASFSMTEVAGKLLFTVILRDISARNQTDEQLRLANEQLRALTARNETIREHERMRIAREIHDVLAQDLTRLKIDLSWVAKRTAKPVDEPTRKAIAARIGEAVAQTDSSITTVQRIATELRPVILDSLALPAAIEWQVEDFARRTGLTCRARASQEESALGRECATAVFRILQESLTNIARYARATVIEVEFVETSDEATLTIADNGCGITAAQIADPRSIGLLGMHERAQAFGGKVDFTGRAGVGTTVLVRIPLPKSASLRND